MRQKKTMELSTLSQQAEEPMVVVPDRYAEEDLIGYSDYGEGLVQMIRSVQSDGSFTIGVFGQWGQGKTSMLRQIKKSLDTSSDKNEPIITAWFNPWQFTKEEHIIIPFFHTLVSYFEEYKEENKTISQKAKEKIGFFLKELANVPTALAYGLKTSENAPLLLGLSFKDMIDEARRHKVEIKEDQESEDHKAVKEYQSLYYRLISRLERSSCKLGLKVVVFIDDLDRCLPEKAVELLEGIKVLLDIPGFVFVIGVAREVIERGIRVRYHELYRDRLEQEIFLEHDYLDKIIQFPFTLPAPNTDRLHSMISAHLKDIPQVEPYLSIIHQALGDNPRCLKRFVNNLSYTFWVAKKKVGFHPGLLVKMTLIAFLFPTLYQRISKSPSHLLRIQKYLQIKPQLDDLNKYGKITEEEQKNKLLENNIQHPDDFIEIKALSLFERPCLDTITIILGNGAHLEHDKNLYDKLHFETEQEVADYAGLLTTTSSTKSEASLEITNSDLRGIIAQRMIKIPAGSISLIDERSGNDFTTNIKEFHLDKYPVTQDLYREISGENPSDFKGADLPVERVSWFDAVKFCNLLSDKFRFDRVYQIDSDEVTLNTKANGFRLPFEAEWECACRAGTTGDRYGELDDIAWYKKNSEDQSHGVGQKSPNNWGLYDMLGNVWEWCWDWYDEYPTEDRDMWLGSESGDSRVLRGGSWIDDSGLCRCTIRRSGPPAVRGLIGFRLARSL